MMHCVARRPSAQLTLVGTRVGAKVAKAVLMSVAAGRLTPEILNEALLSSSTIRGHVQREAVRLLVVRVSLRSPQQMQWLLHLVGESVGGLSLTGAISSLTKRSLLFQVANFGLRGSAASAITTSAVQMGLLTCTLVTTNAAFWRRHDEKMSMRQYRYELLTSVYTGMGTVTGGAAGAAVGSVLMPGIGTAFGSVLCSVGFGYIPGYVRDKKGPDDRRRQQAAALGAYTPLRMVDVAEGTVLMYPEELTERPAEETERPEEAGIPEEKNAAAAVYSSGVDKRDEDSEGKEGGKETDAEEEVVWLDFVEAEHPPKRTDATNAVEDAYMRTPNAATAASFSTSSTSSAASLSATSGASLASSLSGVEQPRKCDAHEQKGERVGEPEVQQPHLRSYLRFSPPSSLSLLRRPPSERVASAGVPSSGFSATSSFADLSEAAATTNTVTKGSAPFSVGEAVESVTQRFQGHAKYVTVTTDAELEAEVTRFGREEDLLFVFA